MTVFTYSAKVVLMDGREFQIGDTLRAADEAEVMRKANVQADATCVVAFPGAEVDGVCNFCIAYAADQAWGC